MNEITDKSSHPSEKFIKIFKHINSFTGLSYAIVYFRVLLVRIWNITLIFLPFFFKSNDCHNLQRMAVFNSEVIIRKRNGTALY